MTSETTPTIRWLCARARAAQVKETLRHLDRSHPDYRMDRAAGLTELRMCVRSTLRWRKRMENSSAF